MRPLKAFWPRTESSNRVRSSAFGTDPSSKKQSWMNSSSDDWKKSSSCRLAYFWSTLKTILVCFWMVWFGMCCVGSAPWTNDPAAGFELWRQPWLQLSWDHGARYPEGSEESKWQNNDSGLQQRRLWGHGRQDWKGCWPSGVAGPPGAAFSKPESYSSQRSSSDSKVCHEGTVKFQLDARKIPFHKGGAQILEQVVQKCCKTGVFEDVKKFWTMPWTTGCNFSIFCALSTGLDSDSGIAFQNKLFCDLCSWAEGWVREWLLKSKLLFLPYLLLSPGLIAAREIF